MHRALLTRSQAIRGGPLGPPPPARRPSFALPASPFSSGAGPAAPSTDPPVGGPGVPRWRVTVTYFTAAKGVREWKGEVEAETTEAACEAAMRAARRGDLPSPRLPTPGSSGWARPSPPRSAGCRPAPAHPWSRCRRRSGSGGCASRGLAADSQHDGSADHVAGALLALSAFWASLTSTPNARKISSAVLTTSM